MRKTDYTKYAQNSPLIKQLKNSNRFAFARSSIINKGESNKDQVDESKETNNNDLSKEFIVEKLHIGPENHEIRESAISPIDFLSKKFNNVKLSEPFSAGSRDNHLEIQIKYLACTSRDVKLDHYYNSTSALKYLNFPTHYTNSKSGKKIFNLFYQWFKFTGFTYRRDIPRLINLYQSLEQYEISNKTTLHPDFLSNKSILKYIMGVANRSRVKQVEANVKLTNDGIICLSNNDYRGEMTNKYSFAGSRFESIVSFSEVYDKSVPVKKRLENPTIDNFESFHLLLNMELKSEKDAEPISIIFTSEVDCAVTDDKPVEDLTNYIELKCFCISDLSQMNNVFEQRKLVEKVRIAYFQSLISGGNKIVVGFRSEDGYLTGIRSFSHRDLEKQLQLDRKVVLSNFYNVIKWIKDNITGSEKAYRLFLKGSTIRLQEYADENNKRLISEYSYNDNCFQYRNSKEEKKVQADLNFRN